MALILFIVLNLYICLMAYAYDNHQQYLHTKNLKKKEKEVRKLNALIYRCYFFSLSDKDVNNYINF